MEKKNKRERKKNMVKKAFQNEFLLNVIKNKIFYYKVVTCT